MKKHLLSIMCQVLVLQIEKPLCTFSAYRMVSLNPFIKEVASVVSGLVSTQSIYYKENSYK